MGGEGQKIKILALGPNSNKFCIHNLWATRWLEIQKLGAEMECRGPGVVLGGVRGVEVQWA